MTITESPARGETYQPAPVKKRRVASLIVAGVAGVAGLALAATFVYISQPGTGDYAGDQTEHVIAYNDLALGQLAWSGANYAADDAVSPVGSAPAPVGSAETKAPDNAVHSQITLTNKDLQNRQVVRLVDVTPDGPDGLYNEVWVRIERQDPTGENGAAQFKYFGPLSQLSNLYMGNIVQGLTQTFDVLAWTSTARPATTGGYSTVFKVNYRVATGDNEDASTPTQLPQS